MSDVGPDDQVIRYVEIRGRDVAWAAVGEGPPLVVGGWWASHLELDWEDPLFRRFVGMLAAHRTVIRYDRPGVGLSDRAGGPPHTVAEESEFLAGVIARLPRPVSLFGASSGGVVAARYAAEHPEDVDALVLYGAFAAGRDIAPPAARRLLLGVIEGHWGIGSRVLADIFLPDAGAEERERFAVHQRRTASPATAAASLRSVYEADATDALPQITVPTLVLHRGDDRAIPAALGRDLAARIPGARFAPLEGIDHFPWRGDAASVAAEMLAFLGVPDVPAVVESARPAPSGGDLSPREVQILELIARGSTDQQIATALVVSAHTVHRHVANIRTKLGVPSRAAAAAWAAERGLI